MTEPSYFKQLYLQHQLPEQLRRELAKWPEIVKQRSQAADRLLYSSTARFWRNLLRLEAQTAVYTDFHGDTITIGRQQELSPAQHEILYKVLLDLRPWRKGPFNYFGVDVQGEWQSSLKWNRIMEWIAPDLTNKIIADVGCNNTYYMYKMLPYKPALVTGFDPMERYYYHFLLNRQFVPAEQLFFELLGVDELVLYENFFDVVFCMGILYHRRNPVSSLEAVAACLKKDGLLILESAGIKGEDPLCLIPERRYMKGKGYWFLPTAKALSHMLGRSGFREIRVHGIVKTVPAEQHKTAWVTTESLEDFLDPSDPEKTVEGYPAPYRIYISARKQ